MSHSNISIFVPHIGCPCRCSFCNQNSITGQIKKPTVLDVDNAVSVAKKSKKYNSKTTELAFFGGSFTAIKRSYMLELLDAAYKYVMDGSICGIRVSTRPDAIDEEILNILKSYGVTAIELGAQSMCEDVLELNHRGHTAEDVENSSKLIKKYGFELGLQMMTGLYGSTYQKDLYSAEQIIKQKPETVRIYPTIILKNTELECEFKNNNYKTYSLEQTVDLCVELLEKFNNNNIKVIRLGLHTIDENDYVAGPWHPAFKELVENKIYLNEAKKVLKKRGNYILFVNEKSASKMIGQNKANLTELEKLGFNCVVKVKSDIPIYKVYPQES